MLVDLKMSNFWKFFPLLLHEEPEFIEWKNDSDYEHDEQCSESKGNEVPLDILDPDSCPNSTFKVDREKEDEPSKVKKKCLRWWSFKNVCCQTNTHSI